MNTKLGKLFTDTNINRKGGNLTYCSKCSNCGGIYVGQTGNALSERSRVHRQQIRVPEVR